MPGQTVSYSWQSDRPASKNRGFIERCHREALKGRSEPNEFAEDRTQSIVPVRVGQEVQEMPRPGCFSLMPLVAPSLLLPSDNYVSSNASRRLAMLSRKLRLVRELMPKSVLGFQQLSPGLRLSQPETFISFLQLRMLPTKRRHCPVEGCAIVHRVVSLAFPK